MQPTLTNWKSAIICSENDGEVDKNKSEDAELLAGIVTDWLGDDRPLVFKVWPALDWNMGRIIGHIARSRPSYLRTLWNCWFCHASQFWVYIIDLGHHIFKIERFFLLWHFHRLLWFQINELALHLRAHVTQMSEIVGTGNMSIGFHNRFFTDFKTGGFISTISCWR